MKAEKKKTEYIERECSMLKDKYEAVKANALQFEKASE